MPHFESDAQVYEQLGGLLAQYAASPQLRRVDAVVQWSLDDPRATITVDLRETGRPRVDLGETKLNPEVTLAMPADTAQALWSGQLSPMVALARGDVRTKGPVAKVLRLVPPIVAVAKGDLEPAPVPEEPEEAPAAEAPAAEASASVEPPAAVEAPAAGEGEAAPAADAAPAEQAPVPPEAPATDAQTDAAAAPADGSIEDAAAREGGE